MSCETDAIQHRMELYFNHNNLCLGICSPECSTFGAMEGITATAGDDVLDDYCS